MLSEKAKGKQRAIDPLLEGASGGGSSASHSSAQVPPPPPPTSRSLVVRFTEGAPDLTITVDKKDAVRDVKRNIRNARPELHNRRLRLIHSGRLLTDGVFLFDWLAAFEERQQRAGTIISDPLDPAFGGVTTPGAQAPVTPVPSSQGKNPSTTWIHCSVGPEMEPGEEEVDKQQTAQINPLRGFDRLASVGFSREDIDNFRQQFHSQSSANYLDLDFATEEEYDEHARALEEQWIDNMDGGSSSVLASSSSSSSSVLQGVLLGFFFPLIPFFFLRSRKPTVFWENNAEAEVPSNVIFP
ncbi:hypothetical protein D9619_001507 [Psilocybe cf. subviscida]|uniref:Ubiquitin-like domain-containing protein n=1 Tax=Psilocybe cf. subviscida TaxID=2480587 RepID=A0A8H5F2T1_9AGAR|nr:hypothetical protein D9619_001507 [Psilocybe cf. subviscida]